ncbi:snoRNA-binding protein [Elasticomyces elasticus]|nr:snoRNA-binding protein [Elasticomyces elasticus]KAK4993436.1 snoRNA-binding protein [Elasticomyces elasticus]
MAKDKSEKEHKEKKVKKEKRKSTDGVTKEKSHKKHRSSDATTALLDHLEDTKSGTAAAHADGAANTEDSPAVVPVKAAEDDDEKALAKVDIPLSALVPFANPLCDEKAGKKVLKSVKKAAKQKCLKRGVKEVVKAVRKTPPANPSSTSSDYPGIVILAADISPMDVISHIPVLCEDHNIPYVYVTSRAELGAASSTKRPTSVVMITPQAAGKKEVEGMEEWQEAYKELGKLVEKQSRHVKV